MHREIVVRLEKKIDRSYRIGIKPGGLSSLPDLVLRKWKGERVFIITDSMVEGLWGRKLQRQLFESGIDAVMVSFQAGEKWKNARTIQTLHTQLLESGIRRNSLIVALGGGVVGDVAGFVAATILRGVAFVQVPTTLLAQVDSSVGGKVGIDHPIGKNLIGAFHQPVAVIIDPMVLRTLQQKEFRNGLAEVVKIAAALDKKFFEFLERNAVRLQKSNERLLTEVIARSVALKGGVVESDEFETGLRKSLNLGHTIGHAIEASTNFSIKHGEAVSMGMAAEAAIARKIGYLEEREYERVLRLLRAVKLPVTMPVIKNRKKFFAALASDKKSSQNNPKFVLLNGIGSSIIGADVPFHFVEQLVLKR